MLLCRHRAAVLAADFWPDPLGQDRPSRPAQIASQVAGARKAALPQSGADSRDRGALDWEIRAPPGGGARRTQARSRIQTRITMEKPKLVYVTFIKTTPEKLWEALTNPDFIQQRIRDNLVTPRRAAHRVVLGHDDDAEEWAPTGGDPPRIRPLSRHGVVWPAQ